MFFAEAVGSLHHSYNRKQKSLGLLCSKFMELYNRDDVDAVGLDDAARNLCVERRRVYDIVNVLESIGVLARKAKNQYSWIGFSGIPKALEILRETALKENSGINLETKSSQETRCSQEDHEDDDDVRSLNHNEYYKEQRCDVVSSCRLRIKQRREKSLGMLTENFVKLFLVSDVDVVTLDEAAKYLLGENNEPSQTKSKVRRLYDIANVLASLNLIEKTHHAETRKPAFKWLGLNWKQGEVTVAMPADIKQTNKRSFGIDISNMDMSKRRKLMAMDDAKQSVQKKANKDEIIACNLTVRKQLQTKGYSFGPFTAVASPKEEEVSEEKCEKIACADASEDVASNFRPDYRNQALHELFGHYMKVWKKWYDEIAQESDTL